MRYWFYRRIYYAMERMEKNGRRHKLRLCLNLRQRRKKQIIICILLGGALFVSAQKNTWTIGLYTGVQGQLQTYHRQEYHRDLYSNYDTGEDTLIGRWQSPELGMAHTFSNIPPIELSVKYNIRDRLSLVYGVGYRSYFTKVKGGGRSFGTDVLHYTARTDIIQVPIVFQYDMPLKKKGFSFFLQWGLGFDVGIYHKSWGTSSIEEYDEIASQLLYVQTFVNSSSGNFLVNYVLHTGFGFSYQFNSGVGISLSGKHNIGLAFVNELSYNIQFMDAQNGYVMVREFKEQSGCRESWNVLLGITYTFKKKQKE